MKFPNFEVQEVRLLEFVKAEKRKIELKKNIEDVVNELKEINNNNEFKKTRKYYHVYKHRHNLDILAYINDHIDESPEEIVDGVFNVIFNQK